jgi:hypothetical protein
MDARENTSHDEDKDGHGDQDFQQSKASVIAPGL